MLQCVRAFYFEVAALVAIAVDVSDGMLRQLFVVLLDPFCRAHQHGFLGIPGAVDDGALGPPTLLRQFSERARLLQQGDLPGRWVFRSVHPGIVVIAADHPLVGGLRARNPRDHVVDFLHVPIKIHLEMHFRFARTHVIRNRQPAAPFLGRHRPFQRGQQAAARRRTKWAGREFS